MIAQRRLRNGAVDPGASMTPTFDEDGCREIARSPFAVTAWCGNTWTPGLSAMANRRR